MLLTDFPWSCSQIFEEKDWREKDLQSFIDGVTDRECAGHSLVASFYSRETKSLIDTYYLDIYWHVFYGIRVQIQHFK